VQPLRVARQRACRRHERGAGAYNAAMYLVAIAWLYVTVLMALTESNVVAGMLSLLFYGLLPVALLLWLFGGSARRRRAARSAAPADRDEQPPAP